MASKRWRARAKMASVETAVQKLRRDPNVFVLELGGGIFDYVPMGAQNNRFRIVLMGRAWEHVSEDALGRWVYRMVK